MKHALVASLVWLALNSAPGLGQEMDRTPEVPDLSRYMVRPYLDCRDVTFNVFDLLPGFFYEDKPDSVFAFLAYWRDRCGPAEPILRAEILASIWAGVFSEDLYGEEILDELLWFEQKSAGEEADRSAYLLGWDYSAPSAVEEVGTSDEFDHFTADLADQMLSFGPPDGLEHLFCRFYRGQTDTLFLAAARGHLRGTKLQRAYDEDVARLRRISDLDLAVTTGAWIPRGGLGIVGAHPTLGGLIGLSGRRWTGRLAGELRLAGAEDFYSVQREEGDDLEWTKHFLGVYLGLEGGLRLFRASGHAVEVLAGLGYDGVLALPADADAGRSARWLHSLNLNAGLAYRHFFGKHGNTRIGLEVRIEDTDHDTGGGSDLSGEAWNVRLVLGWSGDRWRNRRLTALRAERW
ncbi:MAG: hypothetical protein ABIF77_18825 [bacterium]